MLLIRPAAGRSGRRLSGRWSIHRWARLACPTLALLVVFFLPPLILMSLRSVTDPPNAGLSNYRTFFVSEADVRVLIHHFHIAAISTVVCLLIGYPYAYLMNSVSPRVAGLLLIVVLVPFWSSLLVRT